MNDMHGIEEHMTMPRFIPPFQGSMISGNIPRALPWASMFQAFSLEYNKRD
ncbi:hypothetical protein DES53_12138 [Roseimicrobium gellanilyticum]|uniref:Uncharacterized protein n=1 Tax=Roseimicrobium gellanilyticum TaxID=748857 RepID=A0A366H381_9BACT|nr:hypothetical protein DES53_12138 [Roseimicrobium gellanilyticum]